MANVGKRNTLTVLRDSLQGFYLDGGPLGEILLPRRYIPRDGQIGSELDVFVYLDSEDRLVATTETPLAMVGEFACLRVVSFNHNIGAFLDFGLSKDLLLPLREQKGHAGPGDRIIVYIMMDERSNRMVASMRLDRHLSPEPPHYYDEQPVKILIIDETPLGYNAIVENAHRGLLYHTDLNAKLEPGQKLNGLVRTVRPDGKIDLKLDASGYKRISTLSERILEKLKANRGRLELDDQSSPEAIRYAFDASKKAFKQAVGALYREKKIRFERNGISLEE